jgi:AcrR family transcriptional regulator
VSKRRAKGPPRPPVAADPSERARLLDAADALAQQRGWTGLAPEQICDAAKVPAANFAAHFADTGAYLSAAQQRFMDGIRDRIVERTAQVPAGFDRLRAASEIYLDGCLAHNDLRRWLIEARLTLPALAEGLARQNQVYAMVMAAEFERLGWPQPKAAARLYLAMMMEAGLLEFRAAGAVTDVRETLWDFLRIYH